MSELFTQYFRGDQIENKEVGGACSTQGCIQGFVGENLGKRPLGRPKRRWNDNIKMDLQEVGCENMDWFDLAQDTDSWWALLNAVMNLRVPLNAENFLSI